MKKKSKFNRFIITMGIITLLLWNQELLLSTFNTFFAGDTLNQSIMAERNIVQDGFLLFIYFYFLFPGIVALLCVLKLLTNKEKEGFRRVHRNWIMAIVIINITYYAFSLLETVTDTEAFRPDISRQFFRIHYEAFEKDVNEKEAFVCAEEYLHKVYPGSFNFTLTGFEHERPFSFENKNITIHCNYRETTRDIDLTVHYDTVFKEVRYDTFKFYLFREARDAVEYYYALAYSDLFDFLNYPYNDTSMTSWRGDTHEIVVCRVSERTTNTPFNADYNVSSREITYDGFMDSLHEYTRSSVEKYLINTYPLSFEFDVTVAEINQTHNLKEGIDKPLTLAVRETTTDIIFYVEYDLFLHEITYDGFGAKPDKDR